MKNDWFDEMIQSQKKNDKNLIRKINRRLRKSGQLLKTSRGSRAQRELGRFCIVDTDRNILLWHHVNLEKQFQELAA